MNKTVNEDMVIRPDQRTYVSLADVHEILKQDALTELHPSVKRNNTFVKISFWTMLAIACALPVVGAASVLPYAAIATALVFTIYRELEMRMVIFHLNRNAALAQINSLEWSVAAANSIIQQLSNADNEGLEYTLDESEDDDDDESVGGAGGGSTLIH